MAVDEPTVRMRLRRKLEELVGDEEADLLMDRPPGGWEQLVTKEHLALELRGMESRIDARFAALDGRLDALESRSDSRFDAFESRFDSRFEALESRFESRFDALESRSDSRFEALESRFESLDLRFDSIGSRFDSMGSRFDGKLAELRAEIERGFRIQTWRLFGGITALGAVMVAAVRI